MMHAPLGFDSTRADVQNRSWKVDPTSTIWGPEGRGARFLSRRMHVGTSQTCYSRHSLVTPMHPSYLSALAFPSETPFLFPLAIGGDTASAELPNEARSSSSLVSSEVRFASRAVAVCSPLDLDISIDSTRVRGIIRNEVVTLVQTIRSMYLFEEVIVEHPRHSALSRHGTCCTHAHSMGE